MRFAFFVGHAFAFILGASGDVRAAGPAVVSATAPDSFPARHDAGLAVVELFTSEGCSSCPPADRLLADLAAGAVREGRPIFTLSFHVDYWNSLGWADPFSRPAYTERQQAYARVLGGGAYTPEMIVNGMRLRGFGPRPGPPSLADGLGPPRSRPLHPVASLRGTG